VSFLANRAFPYCKGCGHASVVRRLDAALTRLGLEPSQVVLTTDIGCVGLLDPLFPDVHTVHTIHGRSTAVAAGAALADTLLGDGRMKNVVAIGDGGASIGLLHLAQAALMNVDLAVLLHNNMLYGMTGGQHSGLTPEGFATSTTPGGNWVPALDMDQFVRACQGPFFARKLATDPDLADVIAEAIAFPGFAMVEILELCTGFAVPMNHLTGQSLRAMAEERGQGLGVLIRRDDRRPYHQVYRERFPPDGGSDGDLGRPKDTRDASRANRPSEAPIPFFAHGLAGPTSIVIAGSAGERVQSAAAILCQAAVLSGLHCVQKNDYPVTVGSGFSLSEVKLSPQPILYTGVDAPDAILIVSADGLNEVRGRGDIARLTPGGLVLADASLPPSSLPEGTLSLPLRDMLSAELAALGAVAALVGRTGLLATGSLVAAIDSLDLKDATALRRAMYSVDTLAASDTDAH
jgi:pyruvate/2-oxoacid:ferredoxin oxidoreductase beta subunit/Pyruvate/2-oxoacid:ferredoxin oxidoreductase gamma subunit